MNATTLLHPMTHLARRAERPRRAFRSGPRGGVALLLAWIMISGAFLLDVARTARAAEAREASRPTRSDAMAQATSPLPCSP